MSPEVKTPSTGALTSAKDSSATAPAPASSDQRQQATIRYIDQPDLAETFVDAINALIFDGQTLRIEFGVTRLDEVKPNSPITGRRYPTCRLVMPPNAAVELINRMQQIATGLTQAGIAKPTPRPGAEPTKAS